MCKKPGSCTRECCSNTFLLRWLRRSPSKLPAASRAALRPGRGCRGGRTASVQGIVLSAEQLRETCERRSLSRSLQGRLKNSSGDFVERQPLPRAVERHVPDGRGGLLDRIADKEHRRRLEQAKVERRQKLEQRDAGRPHIRIPREAHLRSRSLLNIYSLERGGGYMRLRLLLEF